MENPRHPPPRFQHAEQVAAVGIAEFHPSGAVLDADDGLLEMLGYTREELRQGLLRWDRFTPPEWLERTRQAIREFETTGRMTPYEKVYVRKDGSRFWGLFAGMKLADGRGVAAVLDVTAWKHTQSALRESEQRLRLGLKAGNTGTWEWDIPAKRVTWSEAIYEFHALRPGEFGGRVEDFTPLVVPEDRDRVATAIRDALEKRAPYHIEYRALLSDGKVRWILTTGEVYFGPDGAPLKMFGAATDVTERRLAEEAARDAERRYRAIFEANRDGMMITDAAGAITEANPAACRMHGYTYGQFLRLRPEQLIHPDDLPLFADYLKVLTEGASSAPGRGTCAATAVPSPSKWPARRSNTTARLTCSASCATSRNARETSSGSNGCIPWRRRCRKR